MSAPHDVAYLLEGIGLALAAVRDGRPAEAGNILEFCLSSLDDPPRLSVATPWHWSLLKTTLVETAAKHWETASRTVRDPARTEFRQTADWPAGVRF